GFLIALRVRNRRGDVIATGLFPHDERAMYFWGGASSSEGYQSCANEYMQWKAMCLAANRGVSRYDMSGNGLFKKKFGGELIERRRWTKCYSSAARWSRSAYQFLFDRRLRLEATLRNVVQPRMAGPR